MDIGDRMKTYEQSVGQVLIKRCPAIIRIDGKAFHTFTKGFSKPFDIIIRHGMHNIAMTLCAQIQNARIAYSQSDEVSILLVDYNKFNSQQWLGGKVQKIASVAASIATLAFSRSLRLCQKTNTNDIIDKKIDLALFDARVFSIPREDVTNYFIWRQQDAVRNSIQNAGQALFSHKELMYKNCDEIQEMLFQKYGLNWNDYQIDQKRGFCAVKECDCWHIDTEIPTFTQDRDFIEKHVNQVEEE